MARIYPVSHSPDGRFSERTNRCDGIRHGDDPRWSEFLLDALLRILRWQTGRRKNRPVLAQTGYDKKRDQPSSSLHCGIARLRRYTALDCPLHHSSLDVLHSKQAGELCADTVAYSTTSYPPQWLGGSGRSRSESPDDGAVGRRGLGLRRQRGCPSAGECRR